MSRKHTFSILMLSSLIIVSSIVSADQSTNSSAVFSKKHATELEATASSPQDHQKLAAYYRAQEQKFAERVRYHQEMAALYRLNPLPYDGKTAVPMQRHCKEWTLSFAKQAERAAVLAKYHEQKALGSAGVSALDQFNTAELLSSGLGPINVHSGMIEASPAQNSLYRESINASTHFYDDTRILAYVVSATGRPTIDTRDLRKSATVLFTVQRQFFDSLTTAQQIAIEPSRHDIEKARRDIEYALSRLEQTTSSTDKAYFKSVTKMKKSLERWHSDEQQIGVALGLTATGVADEAYNR